MELNEIKKALYMDKPIAELVSATKEGIRYGALCQFIHHYEIVDPKVIYFFIPFSDMGDAVFHQQEPAQLLIRYLIPTEDAR